MSRPDRMPEMEIDVAIELRIPDNTAFTVLTALRNLGYSDLVRVERTEHVILTVAVDIDPESLVQKLAHAEVLFNPNKHRLAYALAGGALVEPPEYEAFVRDKDENTSGLLHLLTGTFGVAGAQRLERAVGWRLFETAGPAPAQRLQWACTALLCNLVSQTYEIKPRLVRRPVGEPQTTAAKSIR